MKNKYGNAEEILPEYILNLVRRHFPTGLLWVSPDNPKAAHRKESIIQLYGLGYSPRNIGQKVKCSPRWVRQILHNAYGPDLPKQELKMDDSMFDNLRFDEEEAQD